MKGKKKWIQEAIKRPGRLRRLYKREHKDGEEPLPPTWLVGIAENAKKPKSLRAAARLALRLKKMRKRKKSG